MGTLLMNGKQEYGGRRAAASQAVRKPVTMRPVVPLLTRLLVVVVVAGVLALLLGLSLTPPAAPPIAVDTGRRVAELPRVVVSGKRAAVLGRPVPTGTTSKDL